MSHRRRGPAAGVILAGYGHGGEAAVRDFYVRSGVLEMLKNVVEN